MSGPSDKAVERVAAAAGLHPAERLREAHDPALGLDRSVCLRAVPDRLREKAREYERIRKDEMADAFDAAADFIEREFGGGS